MTRYERAIGGSLRNTTDDRGNVQIKILHVGPGRNPTYKKGNITRTITIKDTTVSEIAATIEDTLFGQLEEKQT